GQTRSPIPRGTLRPRSLTIRLLTGMRSDVDQTSSHCGTVDAVLPPTPTTPSAVPKPPRIAEFVLEVVLEGLPLGGAVDPKQPDELRRYVLDSQERLGPTLKQELETELGRMGVRHLGERGWMISRVEIEIGSLKLTVALLVSLEVFARYGALRQ